MKRLKEILPAHDCNISSSSSHQEMENLWSVNNDILFEVLSTLKAKELILLKGVSRRWQNLISDRSFIQVQSKKKEPLSGFLLQQRFEWIQDDIKTISYVPIKTGGHKLHQKVFDFLPESVAILSLCNGLVCCRSCFPCNKPSIYVCNPLNKNWIKVDWPEPDKESSIALAFDPSQDFADNSTDFNLVKVRQLETKQEQLYFSFDIYSSKTRNWKQSKEICWCSDSLQKNKGLFVKGFLHWLTDSYQILTFGVENELAVLISPPLPAHEFESSPETCIGESDGQLNYIIISEQGLHVWFLEDYFDLNWTLNCSMTLTQMEKKHPRDLCKLHARISKCKELVASPWVDPLAFQDGILLMRVSNDIYLYHMYTSTLDKVGYISKFGSESMFCTVLPYSMSLVPLNPA